jgi:hypothetical protein
MTEAVIQLFFQLQPPKQWLQQGNTGMRGQLLRLKPNGGHGVGFTLNRFSANFHGVRFLF